MYLKHNQNVFTMKDIEQKGIWRGILKKHLLLKIKQISGIMLQVRWYTKCLLSKPMFIKLLIGYFIFKVACAEKLLEH